MIKNYLTIALCNLQRHKVYTLINVAGLAVGMACCLLILLYVQDEQRYDRYHQKADRIYRVVETVEGEGGGERSASIPLPAGEALRRDFPDLVEAAVRFFDFQAPALTLAFGEDKKFNEPRLFFTDPTVFEAFDFRLREGDARTALTEPYTIVLTEAMARKYFGTADPIGKVLRFENEHDFRVTGLLEDVPLNSHFQFDFLASFSSLEHILPEDLRLNWYWNPAWTYVVLPRGVRPSLLAARFPSFIQKYFPDVIKHDLSLGLQPLTDIHLHSRLDYEIEPNSSAANVYIFSFIALFILLIACINFMNLATARSAGRAREVGMRKVLGAHRQQLVRQFLSESILMSLVAVVLAVVLLQLGLPAFNAATGKALTFDPFGNWLFAAGLLVIALVVGFGAGLYPAFVLSAFQPARVLKSSIYTGTRGLGFRRTLVVMQFAISIVLMAGTIVAYNQLRHLLGAELGFDKEQVVMLPVSRSPLAPHYEAFKAELLKHNSIVSVTALEEVLGAKHQTANYQWEGMPESRLFPRLFVRHDFTKTFNITLAAGRDYRPDVPTDVGQALLVNEAMVRQMGWGSPEEAVGKPFYWQSREGTLQEGGRIIGVVKDFNFTSLHHPIAPLVLDLNTQEQAFDLFIKYVALRLQPGQTRQALAHLEATWSRFAPDRPFEYFFLDSELDALYRAEDKLGKIAGSFALLALLVACLGLFGLAAFTAEQRTREIGIRKVLGAPVSSIVLLLSQDFLRLVLIAFVVAVPVAYVFMLRWLNAFAYRTEIRPGLFLLAGLAALLIALLTVSYQAVKAALTNPVEALRYE